MPRHALSISDAAKWTGDFLKREWPLLAPLAFAFLALPGLAAALLVPGFGAFDPAAPAGTVHYRPWMLWLVPMMLLALLGGMAITALTVRSRITVGEALSLAAARLWVPIAGLLLVSAAILLLLSLVTYGMALSGLPDRALTGYGLSLTLTLMIVAVVRLAPLLPVVMAEPVGPIAALRRAAALTRGHFLMLAGVLLLLWITAQLVGYAAGRALGTVALLLGPLIGAPLALTTIAAVLVAALSCAMVAAGHVLIAGLYRQLAARR